MSYPMVHLKVAYELLARYEDVFWKKILRGRNGRY